MNLIPPCLVLSRFTLGLSSLQSMAKTPCFSEYNPSKMSAKSKGSYHHLGVLSPSHALHDSCLFWQNTHFSGGPDQLQTLLVLARLGSQPICIGHLSWRCLIFTKYFGLSRLEASIFDAVWRGIALICDNTQWVSKSSPKPLCVISNVNRKVSKLCELSSDLLDSSRFPNALVLRQQWHINSMCLYRFGLRNFYNYLFPVIPFLLRPRRELSFQRFLL